jgi:hypothetical protein
LEGFTLDAEYVKCWIVDVDLYRRNISDSPLNKRGWVYQERYLAPRILHFCRDQLFWECRELSACEAYPAGFLPVHKQYIRPSVKLYTSALETGLVEDPRINIWLNFWNDVVIPEYSGMELTVPEDKLIALSGIAKHVMSVINATYVAGMWKEYLGESLLWCTWNHDSSSRPVRYRAPSWSWASIDGPVCTWWTLMCSKNLVQVEVKDVVLIHATEDPTGAVTGGWLDLRGSLKPIELCAKDYGYGFKWFIIIGDHIISNEDRSIEESERRSPFIYFDVAPTNKSAFEKDYAEKRLFFMPHIVRSPSMFGLLLRLVDVEKKTFERFGIFRCRKFQGRELMEAELDEETKASLPCLRYEDGLHTIRIV